MGDTDLQSQHDRGMLQEVTAVQDARVGGRMNGRVCACASGKRNEASGPPNTERCVAWMMKN